MSAIRKLKRMLRGKVSASTVALESFRRIRAALSRRRERSMVSELNRQPARLREQFAQMSASDLLTHFQSRAEPTFFPGFGSDSRTAEAQKIRFPKQTEGLLTAAHKITDWHSWPLLGLQNWAFEDEEIQWRVDPRSWQAWPLSYHADIDLIRNDGSDVRFVWELNRLGHFITLGRAYALTNDETFSAEFFKQLASWRTQNPVAMGVNWAFAMEVALRSINLLAAFVLFLRAPQMSAANLLQLLTIFDQHGAHIERNLEFSHIATSNHYLSDVVGLFWLGLMLPELEAASRWREFGWRELLQEMDKQILPDGAHYECSTGYHRFVLELFLYSFLLARLNNIEVEEKYWQKLRAMLEYVRAYLRPDGRAPLIGDSDSGQVLPIVRRAGDDHAYVLALGAVLFEESDFKLSTMPEEVLWVFGDAGRREFQALPNGSRAKSKEFPDVGTVVLREGDAYLLLNASGVGMNGRGSHRHNDALAIEVSACGTAFIIDPGSYIYTGDLEQRHSFRSTAYHSTVQVNDREQRTIAVADPFSMGKDGDMAILRFKNYPEGDLVIAKYYYRNRGAREAHERTVAFNRDKRYWLIDDEMSGSIHLTFHYRFHFAPGLHVTVRDDGIVEAYDSQNGARLLIIAEGTRNPPIIEDRFSSRDYGAKTLSLSVCWSTSFWAPKFIILPVSRNENLMARVKEVQSSKATAKR